MPLRVASEPSFGSVVRQMNKFMDQLQKGYYSFCPRDAWTPNVNLYESDASYVVCVDLAGVDKEKIDLTVVENQLKLRGQRAVPAPEEEAGGPENASARLRVHMMEIDHGSFCREVELPANVDRDNIAASYRNGMLWIELPKK